MREVITHDEFKARLKAQGAKEWQHAVFVCPMCKSPQSAVDLVNAGAGKTTDDVGKIIGFSCVGRHNGAGPYKAKGPAKYGCDWTLGGLFHLHELEVETPDGIKHIHFAPATPEQARAHWEATGVLAEAMTTDETQLVPPHGEEVAA